MVSYFEISAVSTLYDTEDTLVNVTVTLASALNPKTIKLTVVYSWILWLNGNIINDMRIKYAVWLQIMIWASVK